MLSNGQTLSRLVVAKDSTGAVGVQSTTSGGYGRDVSTVERCGSQKVFKVQDVIGKRGGSHPPDFGGSHNNCVPEYDNV